mmetsp:Transcript_59979/g.111243  ORF Transcript_59979/g.111243 Transcript_59979/m.111243 type:complete len:949 (-) Transcript_59979:65-2911(-)
MEREIRRRFSHPAANVQVDPHQQMLIQILTISQEIGQAVARLEEHLSAGYGAGALVAASSYREGVKMFGDVVSVDTDHNGNGGAFSRGSSYNKIGSDGLGKAYNGPVNGLHRAASGLLIRTASAGGSPDAVPAVPEDLSQCDRMSRGSSFLDASEAEMSASQQAQWQLKLGSEWPSNIGLRPGLEGSTTVDGERIVQAVAQGGKLLMSETKLMEEPRPWLPLDPNGKFATRVEMLKLAVLLHDIIAAPYLACWDVRLEGNLMISAVIAAVFWVIDLTLHFFTGYYHKGELVMIASKIVKHYFKGRLLRDASLILCDFMVICSDAFLPSSSTSLLLEVLITFVRSCRLLRLLRVVTLIRLLDKISKRSLTATTLLIGQVIKIPLGLIVYNHIVACTWGVIGRTAPTNTGQTWLDGTIHLPGGADSASEEMRYNELVKSQQYLVALHWALAQMTPGPVNIHAGSSVERAFNVCVLVCGMLFGSMIVSQFSSIIMQMTLLQRESFQKLDKVRRFLGQRRIGSSLASRVQRQVTQRLGEEVPLQVHDVPAFDLLSNALRDELLREVRVPHLFSHSIFALWAKMDKRGFHSFCHLGVQFFFLPAREVLFEPLQDGNEAYLVVSGLLRYGQEALSWEHPSEELVNGTWLCEAALWSSWVHVGKAEAISASELLVVSSDALMNEFGRDHPACHLLKSYGRSYHQRILSAVPPYAPWPTDIRIAFTEVSDLLGPHVGIGMLQSALGTGVLHMSKQAEQELIQELLEEKCALTSLEDGSLQRIVSVVALKVKDRDGNIFVELGKCDAKGIRKAACVLPGGKRAMNEVPQVAMQRVLDKRLPCLQGTIVLEGTNTLTETKASQNFNMTTVYTKLLHLGTMSRPIKAIGCYNKDMHGKMGNMVVLLEEVTFVIDRGGGWTAYAWLPQSHLDILQAEDGQASLQTWFADLQCDYAFKLEF